MRIPKQLPFLLLLWSTVTLSGQSPETESIGEIGVQPIVHGTLALEYQDKTIYVDPYGGADKFKEINAPDIVLITDIHGDHYNPETLSGLPLENATLVVPAAVAEQLSEQLQEKAIVIANDENKTIQGIEIKAIPMYNLPETEESRHPKGRGNGYILTLGEQKVYISGDTEDIPEMRALKDIDIAFVCMNMPYTMTVDQAASAVNEFKPGIVYPYHYRGRPEMSDTEKFKALVEEKNDVTEVRLRNWYQE
ncbi:MBL fold metallo-hydrolase [Robertkochia marina]|uniref:MBL fold metallo-hydrolase n=1 Tax=Robertkochia marina TaxID=1227945 RepID=A0A4S3M079_9FLAO|nr:MBL fold metallo-hydrolase [Robertkochia marina]THD67784.1 MBL fold metallo-hydrolase [Robertkochia marina]TRZ41742.1 MBL fold metallo-hydrolase [Robertkochia marina]